MSAADELGMHCGRLRPGQLRTLPGWDASDLRPTTIELRKYEVRDTAVQLLLERVEGKHTRAKTVTLQPQLRVSESCGFMLRSINAAVTAGTRLGLLLVPLDVPPRTRFSGRP